MKIVLTMELVSTTVIIMKMLEWSASKVIVASHSYM